AIAALAVLKVAGLVIDGAYVFDYRVQQASQAQPPGRPSWAQAMLNFPGAPKIDPSDVTGSVHGAPKEAPKKEEAPHPAAPDTKPDGVVIHPEENQNQVSPSERAILERLQARRQELEARQREIDIRESLLKAAEKRIE